MRRSGSASGGLLSRPGVRGGKRIAPVHHECESAPALPFRLVRRSNVQPAQVAQQACGPRGWTPSIFQLSPSAVKL